MGYVVKSKARYRNDNTGREVLLPVLLTEQGILLSHLRFMASIHRSESWRERLTYALMLLLKFIHANQDAITDPVRMLEAFSAALYEGTVNPSDLSDPSGLFWQARNWNDANNLLSLITLYTDWLTRQEHHCGNLVNPYRVASNYEERMNWCAYYHQKLRVFLPHTVTTDDVKERMSRMRVVSGRRIPQYNMEEVKKFPEDKIQILLDGGFVSTRVYNCGEDVHKDYKSILITMLLHWGGVRKSEALSIYLEDVFLDSQKQEAIVRIYHPSIGRSPDDRYVTRKQYLAQRFMLKPRNEYRKTERLHLGWKAPALDNRENYFVVQFYPPSKAVEFNYVLQKYLKYQRMKPPAAADHPYLFTNMQGHPETLKNYQRLHRAAVIRVGLTHEKYHGTTEHGHRHAYGYRLAEHGLTNIDIQKAMHHKSPDSCLVYTQPTNKELREKMEIVNDYR